MNGSTLVDAAARRTETERRVLVPIDGAVLEGDLTVVEAARGIVLFAHGSGSSRFSPRNRRVAETIRAGGTGTFLIDLLTPEEEEEDMRTSELRFNIPLLAERVIHATVWLAEQPETSALRIGLFGASTGAAAALRAAALRPGLVSAVVSRGGRPDLAREMLAAVRAPTLLIVGSADPLVLELNRRAAARLQAVHRLEVIPGAGHLFEEPGALDRVARLASEWFDRHLE